MQKLFGRNNIICKTYGYKNIYIYEDHRTILNVLWTAREAGIFSIPPTLICFDKHDDFKYPAAEEYKISMMNNKTPTKEEFWSFTEWDLSPQDDDWIKSGMELDLIGSIILIGAQIKPNLSGFSNSYTSRNGREHFLYSVDHIWKGFAQQGWLTDLTAADILKPVWDYWDGDIRIRAFTSIRNQEKQRWYLTSISTVSRMSCTAIPLPGEMIYF